MTRYELTRSPGVRRLLQSRWPQLTVQAVALAGLALVIASALLGTPVGNRNFAIVMVWIAWWAALMLVAVPLLGRTWCSICPLPLPGEWLQRGAVLGPRGRGFGLGLRWPKRLRNLWLQNGAFVLVALFSLPVLTQPRLTGLLLAGLVLLAIALSLVFERRAFCRYVCPVGGFIGLYAQAAPIEVRVRDATLCAAHATKTCYTGSEKGYGCPWQVYPGALNANTYCGVCMECLRTCPYDNVAVNLRPFGADLSEVKGRGLDETFKAVLLLGSGLAYSGVLLGAWSTARLAAANIGSIDWLVYAAGFLAFVLVLVPAFLLLALRAGLWLSGSRLDILRAVRAFSPALIPLGLSLWIAFSLSFLFPNISYIFPVMSDPLNLGWNLLGTAGLGWTPYGPALVPLLTVGVVLVGLAWTSRRISATAESLGGRAGLALPLLTAAFVMAAGALWLLVF
ncbi:MAG TPA: 4Fe-4S binding protein [Anaerolineales bacterium]|nr:4Fe-4S binding protein [Anaerolineales bacterium]